MGTIGERRSALLRVRNNLLALAFSLETHSQPAQRYAIGRALNHLHISAARERGKRLGTLHNRAAPIKLRLFVKYGC
jgi:hypothetical protein